MKQDNQWDFEIPQRQSYVAILLIIYKYYKIIIRQLWPVLLIILFNGKSGRSQYFLYLILAVSLLSMIIAIVAYFKFYFYLQNDELIIEKGIFKKTITNIPLDRVQTINKEQNLIHQVFSVVMLKIDTAGSVKNEFVLDALSVHRADALRNLLLSKKSDNQALTQEQIEDANVAEYHDYHEPIMSLSIIDIIKVGVSQNHFKSGILIFVFLMSIYHNLEEAGFGLENYEDQLPSLSWDMSIWAIGFFALIFFVVSFVVSLIRTFLTNFDLHFSRQKSGFKVSYGLFNKKEFAALDRKIQIMSWSDSLLKKIFNINDLVLKQASSIAVNTKKAISIAGCTPENIQKVYQYYFGDIIIDQNRFEKVDIRYFYRKALFSSLLALGIIGLGVILSLQTIWLIGAFLLIYWLTDVFLQYRKMKFYVSKDIIRIHGGSFGDKHNVIHAFKIQAIKIAQSPYQSRNQLASLHLYTASGMMKIPYIGLHRAIEIHDFLLYTVEQSQEDWM